MSNVRFELVNYRPPTWKLPVPPPGNDPVHGWGGGETPGGTADPAVTAAREMALVLRDFAVVYQSWKESCRADGGQFVPTHILRAAKEVLERHSAYLTDETL